MLMAKSILNKIEYLVLLVAAFAAQSKISEAEAYRISYLCAKKGTFSHARLTADTFVFG